MFKHSILCSVHSEPIVRVYWEHSTCELQFYCVACVLAFDIGDARLKKMIPLSDHLKKIPINGLSEKEMADIESSIGKHEAFIDEAMQKSSQNEGKINESVREARGQIENWFNIIHEEITKVLQSTKAQLFLELDNQLPLYNANLKAFKEGLSLLKKNMQDYAESELLKLKNSLQDLQTTEDLRAFLEKYSGELEMINYYRKKEFTQDLSRFKDILAISSKFPTIHNLQRLSSQMDAKIQKILKPLTSELKSVLNDELFRIPEISPKLWDGLIPSEILRCKDHRKIAEFTKMPYMSGKLLYRGSQHGLSFKEFQGRCKGFASLLIIIRIKENQHIIGCYITKKWESETFNIMDPNAFSFSLNRNKKTNQDRMTSFVKSNGMMLSIGQELVITHPFDKPTNSSIFYNATSTTGGKYYQKNVFSIDEIEAFELYSIGPKQMEFLHGNEGIFAKSHTKEENSSAQFDELEALF